MFSTPKTAENDTVQPGTPMTRGRKHKIEKNQVTANEVSQKEPVVKKTFNPRKKLIISQFYTLNWSSTKQIHLGLDIQCSFQPTIYLMKQSISNSSGVYLYLDTFKELMDPRNVEFICRYFSNSEKESTKPETLEINHRIKIQFRQFYNQKSVIISNAIEYANIYNDMIILQENSWNNLCNLSKCIIKSMNVLEKYSSFYHDTYNYILNRKHDDCLKIVDIRDIGNLETNVKSTYFKNCSDPLDSEILRIFPYDVDEHISFKIYSEVEIFCAEKIIDEIVCIFKFKTGVVPDN